MKKLSLKYENQCLYVVNVREMSACNIFYETQSDYEASEKVYSEESIQSQLQLKEACISWKQKKG